MAVVLITGCSKGIGLLTALQFARKGDTVFASMRDTSRAGDLQKRAETEKLAIEVVQLDVTDDASVRRAVAHVISSAGCIDVLVNNAGYGRRGAIEEADLGEARAVFETNFFGSLRVAQAVLPAMRKQRSGTIVNVSSVAGILGEPYNGIYAASKHALEAASESLYFECHPFGVRVLIVEPSGFDTEGYWKGRYETQFVEGSPHLEYGQRFAEALTKLPGEDQPGDPQVVAEAIYDAVYADQPRLRYLVGESARMIGGLRRQLDDEQFEQTMRQALDIWD